MGEMSTLHEICVAQAKKQLGMVDSLTEEAPVLARVKWKPASHKMWHVAEKLTDIKGAAFVEADSPLPIMGAGSDLVHTDLHVMGGMMEVPTLRARKFGGMEKYFAERQNALLKKAGMDAEVQIIMRNWLAAARAVKNLKDAGGKDKGWFILAVRMDELSNCGLYDPDQFESGRLLKIEYPYGGAEHVLSSPKYEGVLGYAVVYRGVFGYQILDAAKTCAAIVNVDEDNAPTPAMIDDMLADVRSRPGSTFLVCSPKAKIYGINRHKVEKVRIVNGDRDKDASTAFETWNDIPILTSHNISEKIANIKV